jgi:hypothetical protein
MKPAPATKVFKAGPINTTFPTLSEGGEREESEEDERTSIISGIAEEDSETAPCWTAQAESKVVESRFETDSVDESRKSLIVITTMATLLFS